MMGFVYRWGLRIKDFGERIRSGRIQRLVISMNDNWIHTFLDKLINEKFNYVVPSYKRSRFEGSTTNQFAYPILYALTGKRIRQPIGGDFAFDKNYIDYIIKQPYNDSIKKYGIDIYIL